MTARALARRVLARIGRGAYGNLALGAELSRARLSDPDAAFATELVYGTLKLRLRLDRALAACAPRGIDALDESTRDALRIAALQILFLRTPAHAAVDDAVGAISAVRGARLGGFANAMLRRLAREGEPAAAEEGDAAARLELSTSTPRWLVQRAAALLGYEEAGALLAAWNEPAPTWLRINPTRTTREALAASLAARRPRARIAAPGSPALAALAPLALSVRRGGDLSLTPEFGEGSFTAQDLGAQIVTALVEPQPGDHILDACAGVGGKSVYLAALAGAGARLDAADLSPRKLGLAADAAHRLGVPSVAGGVAGAAAIRFIEADLTDATAPLEPAYDRVLLDAPCSGIGVLRRHPELKWRRTADEVLPLASLQARLLGALAGRVRPGGVLVYAVCTFTDEEGPSQVSAFLDAHREFAIDPAPAAFAAVAAEDGAIRTWPHRDDADAFYAVRLRRRA